MAKKENTPEKNLKILINQKLGDELGSISSIKKLPNVSVKANLYHANSTKKGEIVIKTPKELNKPVNYEKDTKRLDWIGVEGGALELSQIRDCATPKFYGRISENGKASTIIIIEYIKGKTLETIVQNKKSIKNILEEITNNLIKLHIDWKKNDGEFIYKCQLEKQKGYADKFAKYICTIYNYLHQQELSQEKKRKIKELFENDILKYFSEVENRLSGIIHNALHPQHIIQREEDKKYIFIDLSGISYGPLLFDILDLLYYPNIKNKIAQNDIEELVKYYIKEQVLEKEDRSFIEKAAPYLAIYRTVRAATKPILLKNNFPEIFKNLKKIIPNYENFPTSYIETVKSQLENYFEENKEYKEYLIELLS